DVNQKQRIEDRKSRRHATLIAIFPLRPDEPTNLFFFDWFRGISEERPSKHTELTHDISPDYGPIGARTSCPYKIVSRTIWGNDELHRDPRLTFNRRQGIEE